MCEEIYENSLEDYLEENSEDYCYEQSNDELLVCFNELNSELTECVQKDHEEDYDEVCYAITEACLIRSECFQFELRCLLEGQECELNDLAYCYQNSSCTLEVAIDSGFISDFLNQDVEIHEFVELELLDEYQAYFAEESYSTLVQG